MKTNRLFIFLVTFLCSWLCVVAAAWPVETKSTAPSKQIAAPPAAGPAKVTQAIKDVAPQVIIINPVDGDTWYGGETRDIQWNTIAIPEGFKIKIRFVLPGKGEYFIADNLPRSGKFSWKLDGWAFQSEQVATGYGGTKTVLSDTTAKLKLIAYDGGKTYEREIPLSLVIPRLKITSPKNGDTWYVGKTYPVKWQSTGPALSPVQINIEAGGGFGAKFLYSTNMGNMGATNITVPTSPILDNTTNFRLIILSTMASFPGTYYNDEVSIKVMK
jgi:hypothetical protein